MLEYIIGGIVVVIVAVLIIRNRKKSSNVEGSGIGAMPNNRTRETIVEK